MKILYGREFKDDFEKLLSEYDTDGYFVELDEGETMLFTVDGSQGNIRVKINEQVINNESLKSIIEKLYQDICLSK